jgi:hypothetical protein
MSNSYLERIDRERRRVSEQVAPLAETPTAGVLAG